MSRYLLSVFEDDSWVKRRVETVTFLDRGRIDRRVSLDISLVDLRAKAETAGIPADGRLVVPFVQLRKTLLLDVDLVGPDGKPASVLTSDEDSVAAQMVMAALLSRSDFTVNTNQLAQLFATARDATMTAVVDDDVRAASPALADAADFFREHFLMMTTLAAAPDSDVLILKYRLTDAGYEDGRKSFKEALGFTAQTLFIECPSISYAARTHLRVQAPTGTYIESEQLYLRDGTKDDPGQPYSSRLTPDRAVCYTSRAARGAYLWGLTFRPRPRGVLTAALLWSLTLLLIVAIGAGGELVGSRLSKPALGVQFTAIIALLMTLTSVGVSNVLRSDEHDVLASSMSAVRGALVVSAGVAVGAGMTVLVDGWTVTIRVLWYGSFVLAFAITLVLHLLRQRAMHSLHDVEKVTGLVVAKTAKPFKAKPKA